MNRLALLCVGLLLVPSVARACAWDSDTLEAEARGVPDVIRALSGRFERNPPLYYEMRLARVEREVRTAPQKLELYDDAIVACDRLGRGDDALAWAAKKKTRLQVLDAKRPNVREHWYRFWANLGTVRAHRWIHNGADRKRIGEVRQARDEIARAISINHDAHFGREKYQLKALQWIVAPPKLKEPTEKLPDFLGLSSKKHIDGGSGIDLMHLKDRRYGDAERGLTGLITLGAAWQSIDIFNALRYVEAWRGDRTVTYLLHLRLRELAHAGRGSLHPQAPAPPLLVQAFEPAKAADIMGVQQIYEPEASDMNHAYARLRQDADDWHARRTQFMLVRLETGRHPDTDSTFWNGWDDGAPPTLARSKWRQLTAPQSPDEWATAVKSGLLLLLFSLTGSVLLLIRFLKRRRKQLEARAG
jgi:FAD/FMN-containing dehydrogenase